jgi:hypothetical protein
MLSRRQDKSIGILRGLFGSGVSAELPPKFYFVLKSCGSPKANAKIQPNTLAAKHKTVVPSQHFTLPPTYLHEQDERGNAFEASEPSFIEPVSQPLLPPLSLFPLSVFFLSLSSPSLPPSLL